ncbi:hypothetical protein LQZ18_03605 [Lachnospiraceae bacterium ZAX-1]
MNRIEGILFFYISKNGVSTFHSWFDFRSYPDKKLDIKICYETCGKTITESYSIDIDFIGNPLTMEPQIKDELSALKNINKSITSLSDKFI